MRSYCDYNEILPDPLGRKLEDIERTDDTISIRESDRVELRKI